MINYDTKKLNWPSRLLNSDNYSIHYNDGDVLTSVTRTSKNKTWKLYKYPVFENHEFVRGFKLVLRNTATGQVYIRVDGAITKFEDDLAYRAHQLGVYAERRRALK